MSNPIRNSYTIPSGAQYGAPRAGGRHHQGTDYHCPKGTPIYATGDGRVVSNVNESGYGIGFGNYVSIAYLGGRVTLDGHLLVRSPLPVGTVVNSSTVVGEVGDSGNAVYADPPGSHDHHQVWLNGVLVDPQSYYTTTAGSGGVPIGEDMPLSQDDLQAIWSFPLSNMLPNGQVGPVRGRAADWLTATANETSAVARDAATLIRDAAQTAQLRADLGTVHQAILNLPKPGTSTGGDNAPLLAAIAELKALIEALPKPPTTFVAQ